MNKKRPVAPPPARVAPTGTYVISYRCAGKSRTELKAVRKSFDTAFSKQLNASVNILSDSAEAPAQEETSRRVIVFQGDQDELQRKRAEFGADTMIEAEMLRYPMRFRLSDYLAGLQGYLPPAQTDAPRVMTLSATPLGQGSSFTVRVAGPDGPVTGAKVILLLRSLTNGQTTSDAGLSGPDGTVSFTLDPSQWTPAMAVVEPTDSYWPAVAGSPVSGGSVLLTPLPKSSSGWWQMLVGNEAYSEKRGAGISIGVVDTGVGPHPYLKHVKGVGAYIGGQTDASPAAAADVEQHGTHVAGIIGARPAEGSGDFGGIAPGADLYAARVFNAGGGANQGDIANAIDELAHHQKVDLINLSLGGGYSSIEFDAVMSAFENGTVCVCAAGNTSGGAVLYPAAYAQVIAVSGIGLFGAAPSGTTAAANMPTQAAMYGLSGTYLAKFSAIGPQIDCAAPGNGIISTVPARGSVEAPYLALDGTSMASPAAAGAIAAMLSADTFYKSQPRSLARAQYVLGLVRARAISLQLNPTYQGAGLVRSA